MPNPSVPRADVPLARRIAQSAGIVMASVLLSRVLGFFRDWTVAHQIGSNAVTDAYYAAFTLPDFLNYLVAGGSLSLTFIPVFAQYVAEKREDEGWHVFSTVISVMGPILITLVLVGEIYAPQLIEVIAPGFAPGEKARAIFLTRLMLPAQICFYLGSILSAVQYAKGQFIVPSLAPVIYNVGIILGGVLLPIMLALSLVFTDDWIIRWFGSYLQPASITWLTYAKTLMRVPLGVVGQAIGVAAFPFLAQLYSEGKLGELNRTLNATLKGTILLLVPIGALTIAESRPLVYFVFSHTRLRGPDLDATAATLVYFSLGMFAWAVQNILARGFYATRDTLTPAVTGTALTFLNLPLYWLLVRHLQHLGLALASSIGVVAYMAVMFVLLVRRTRNRESAALMVFFLKVTAASALAAGASFAVVNRLESPIGWQTTGRAFLVLALVSALGLLLTTVLAKLLRLQELDVYIKKLLPARADIVT
ncbi:MAG: murein biosynthesis integral membrane protein MurJ [Acidobacteriia bacterium]|nr:murein biosynthesis integral membrane protein MurJ [Terriglobia bacterium]